MTHATRFWRPGLRPHCSMRATGRVQPSTILLYAAACLLFIAFCNLKGNLVWQGTSDDLAYYAGEYAVTLENSKVRGFHAGLQHFWPFLDKSRVTAELKGVEKCTPKVPTTPMTFLLATAFASYVRRTVGMPQAVGILVAFGTLLRTAELVKIRRSDIIWRSQYVVRTTIRLGETKNNREQVAVLEPNSIAERALKFLFKSGTCHPFGPIFDIPNYQTFYKLMIDFKNHYRINLHFTPHSLRAGGATNLKLRGYTHSEICDAGRWSSLATSKSYVDVIFNSLPETIQIQNRVTPNGEWACRNFLAPAF